MTVTKLPPYEVTGMYQSERTADRGRWYVIVKCGHIIEHCKLVNGPAFDDVMHALKTVYGIPPARAKSMLEKIGVTK